MALSARHRYGLVWQRFVSSRGNGPSPRLRVGLHGSAEFGPPLSMPQFGGVMIKAFA